MSNVIDLEEYRANHELENLSEQEQAQLIIDKINKCIELAKEIRRKNHMKSSAEE